MRAPSSCDADAPRHRQHRLDASASGIGQVANPPPAPLARQPSRAPRHASRGHSVSLRTVCAPFLGFSAFGCASLGVRTCARYAQTALRCALMSLTITLTKPPAPLALPPPFRSHGRRSAAAVPASARRSRHARQVHLRHQHDDRQHRRGDRAHCDGRECVSSSLSNLTPGRTSGCPARAPRRARSRHAVQCYRRSHPQGHRVRRLRRSRPVLCVALPLARADPLADIAPHVIQLDRHVAHTRANVELVMREYNASHADAPAAIQWVGTVHTRQIVVDDGRAHACLCHRCLKTARRGSRRSKPCRGRGLTAAVRLV